MIWSRKNHLVGVIWIKFVKKEWFGLDLSRRTGLVWKFVKEWFRLFSG